MGPHEGDRPCCRRLRLGPHPARPQRGRGIARPGRRVAAGRNTACPLAGTSDAGARRVLKWRLSSTPTADRNAPQRVWETLRRSGVTRSMGAVGASADNTLAETFDAAFKREVLQSNICWADATPA